MSSVEFCVLLSGIRRTFLYSNYWYGIEHSVEQSRQDGNIFSTSNHIRTIYKIIYVIIYDGIYSQTDFDRTISINSTTNFRHCYPCRANHLPTESEGPLLYKQFIGHSKF